MCRIPSPTLPERIVPLQYRCRASEASKIFSVTGKTPRQIASSIAVAEVAQITFFALLTLFYALAFSGVISPTTTGIIALSLTPIEALASYHTFVHYKPFSRLVLTIASVATLLFCGGLAVNGVVTDSALTLCGGGVALHLFRNISEYIDSRKLRKNPDYLAQILNSTP